MMLDKNAIVHAVLNKWVYCKVIECDLDNCKDIFYSPTAYAQHLLSYHTNIPIQLLKWAKYHIKKTKSYKSIVKSSNNNSPTLQESQKK